MPLPFDDRGLLPVGIHDATLEEVEKAFAYGSSERLALWKHLQEYLKDLKNAQWPLNLIIDGSFIMSKHLDPHDIDVLLIEPKGWEIPDDAPLYQLNLLNKKFTKTQRKMDLYVAEEGSKSAQDMIDFYQQIREDWCQKYGWPVGERKGLVRIVL